MLLATVAQPRLEQIRKRDHADYLVLRHHSVGGLIDRAAAAGLVTRHPDPDRHGTVRLSLTSLGRARVDALAACHQEELARLAPTMKALWRALNESPAGLVSR